MRFSRPPGPDPDPDTLRLRDEILERMLALVPFDGWRWETVRSAAQDAGHEKAMAEAVFPEGLAGVTAHFSGWADRRMMAALAKTDPEILRVRDRIRTAVLTRLEILRPHKEAVRLAASYGSSPFRLAASGTALWRTADLVWNWAGDTATDYNRYTKRSLLCGVLGATTLAWLQQEGTDMDNLASFLDRRIENVMQLGRLAGRFRKAG